MCHCLFTPKAAELCHLLSMQAVHLGCVSPKGKGKEQGISAGLSRAGWGTNHAGQGECRVLASPYQNLGTVLFIHLGHICNYVGLYSLLFLQV